MKFLRVVVAAIREDVIIVADDVSGLVDGGHTVHGDYVGTGWGRGKDRADRGRDG